MSTDQSQLSAEHQAHIAHFEQKQRWAGYVRWKIANWKAMEERAKDPNYPPNKLRNRARRAPPCP
jgi:hypothetical protein